MKRKKTNREKHRRKLYLDHVKREKEQREFEKKNKRIKDEIHAKMDSERSRRSKETLSTMDRADELEDKGLISVFERGKILNESASFGGRPKK